MINKVDPRITGAFASSAAQAPSGPGQLDFSSLLRASLSGEGEQKPVYLIIVESLARILEAILSETGSEEGGVFPEEFMSLPLPPLPQRVNTVGGCAGNGENEGKVSNKLQRGQDFEQINRVIEEAADKYKVEPALIKAVIMTESGGDPRAVSPAGAQGLMQIMPGTAAELGVTDPYDPYQNIMSGTRYLRQLIDHYRGNVRLALAAYNWGMGNLEKRPGDLPKETRDYIVRVEERYRAYAA